MPPPSYSDASTAKKPDKPKRRAEKETERPSYKYSVNMNRLKKDELYKVIFKRYRQATKLGEEQFIKHLDEFANFFGPFMGQALFEKRGSEIQKVAKSNLLVKNEKAVISAFDKLPEDHGAKIIVLKAIPDARQKLIKRVNFILRSLDRKEAEKEDKCDPDQKRSEEGECIDRCPPGFHWVSAEELAAEKENASMDEEIDRELQRVLGENVRNPDFRAKAASAGEYWKEPKEEPKGECRPDPCEDKGQVRNDKGECVDREEKEQEEEKPKAKVGPDIKIYDWLAPRGGVTVVGGYKYKGDLPEDQWAKIFGQQASAFLDMYIWHHMANAALRPGKSIPRIGLEEEKSPLSVREEDIDRELDLLLLELTAADITGKQPDKPAERNVTVDDLYKLVLGKMEKELDNLLATIVSFKVAIGDASTAKDEKQEEKIKEVKAKYEKIKQRLAGQKEELEKSPEHAQIFNDMKEKYYEALKNEIGKKLKAKAPEMADKLGLTLRPDEEEETSSPEEEEEPGMLQEEKLVNITIDFSEIRSKQIDESWLVMFGGWVEWLLGRMFGTGKIPGTIKGSKGEIESFARAMGSEKRYIETAKRYGLDHPTTYKSRAKLDVATKGFERETGIRWPFE